MVEVLPAAAAARIDRHVQVAIVGGGACGLSAAMAARDGGATVLVLERDAVPRGNTAWSIAMIPAAGSRLQRAAGIDDDARRFADDIIAKTKGRTDAAMALRVAEQSGPTIDWLVDDHGVRLRLLTELVYPGHSRHRYHVSPTLSGEALQAQLLDAATLARVEIATGHHVTRVYADAKRRVVAVGGDGWTIGCGALVLATDGFGAARKRVAAHIPDMAEAAYCGHGGTLGDALSFGEQLGVATADLGAYQGHSIGAASGLPQTWALIIDGGIQVNQAGRRFADEMRGYSEQAADIVRQPGGVAWTVFDAEAERNAVLVPHHVAMRASGEIVACGDVTALAHAIGAPAAALAGTLAEVRPGTDRFGRHFTRALAAPYHALSVRGALFHTQGGLIVDRNARAVGRDGRRLPNLFAGGGAARGLSGPAADGYLGGNGLLCALVLGRLAGLAATRLELL